MSRILGIDVGTNSLGLTVRDDSISKDLCKQIVFSSVSIFKSGVGKGKFGEFSYAAERTNCRSQRKLYRVRRYRKWSTLKLLIEEKCCPLSIQEFNRWSHYDKNAEQKRIYPINSIAFQQWIKLDFNGDGKPDYTSPYELRNELATKQLDFDNEENRQKLGRAMYHIAERRGFRSSRGDTIKSQESEENNESELKKSEIDYSVKLEEYKNSNNLPTIGSALFKLIQDGRRIRKDYQVIRKQYKDEINYIFSFQNGLDVDSKLYKKLTSEKKNEGTIFYKKPLKSQKGNVGKCLLEPSKPRCPQSRPEYEEFIAWSFLNNIGFGDGCQNHLTLEQKNTLYSELFVRASDFKFEKIREKIENTYNIKCRYSSDPHRRTINYKDSTNVPASKVSYRLKKLLGENWKTWTYKPKGVTHTNKSRTSSHVTTYTWEDIWHVCFCCDDDESLLSFANKGNLDYKLLLDLWKDISVAYANLSLKAINNINRFLKKGMLYNNACLLAKLPDIFKDKWNEDIEKIIFERLSSIIKQNEKDRKIVKVVNSLIEKYKNLDDQDKFAFHDNTYILQESDYKDIEICIKGIYGETTFLNMEYCEKDEIRKSVAKEYQSFFSDLHRKFKNTRRVEDDLKTFISGKFDFLKDKQLKSIYHHSQIEYYKPAPLRQVQRNNKDVHVKLLESPVIKSLRNPMALRVLHTLRRKVNDLLIAGIISEDDTKVIVEVTRQLNDANMRWAIEKYDSMRKIENDTIKDIIKDYCKTDEGVRKGRLFAEQCFLGDNRDDANIDNPKFYCTTHQRMEKDITDELCRRYRLWLEQECISVYTGKTISLKDLFNNNKIDIEHTLPYSRSFDNSLANNTVCESDFNRNIKKNRMPSELDNYDEILKNIRNWEKKVVKLEENIEFWKFKSKKALDKQQKDYCIRQRHLWELHFQYWKSKVDTFHTKEIKQGFRNNQLVDTSIIAKYTLHFLKSVFKSVDAQKGVTTAQFRKILGIQEGEKKDRSNHIHHAIDAYTLTLIPPAAKRDKILELYYHSEDIKNIAGDYKKVKNELSKEIKTVGLFEDGYKKPIGFLNNNVLVKHEQNNQQLTPSSKRFRVRGKILPERDEKGNIMFEKNDDCTLRCDKNNHPIPIAKYWEKGNCMRGELHKQTYYGKINHKSEMKYVVRIPLEKGAFKNWNELEKQIVDKSLYKIMREQAGERSLNNAIENGLFRYYHKKNKNIGKIANKIRHVRCFAPSNASPTPIKKHVYLSNKEYKQNYYASIGDLPLLVKYVNGTKVKYKSFHLFDLSKNIKNGIISIPDLDGYSKKTLIWKNTMILVYKDNVEDLYNTDTEQLAKHLYVITGFEAPSKINCIRHCIQNITTERGTSNYSDFPDKIRVGATKLNFIIEGEDFDIINGKIKFIK